MALNLRKRYSCKSIANYIEVSKAEKQAKRYRLFSISFYFLGLSYRNTAKRSLHQFVERSHHVSIWKWIQKYKPKWISNKSKKIDKFIMDETQVKVGSQYVWLWVATIEPTKHRQILHVDISFERNMLVAERFFYPT